MDFRVLIACPLLHRQKSYVIRILPSINSWSAPGLEKCALLMSCDLRIAVVGLFGEAKHE